MRGGGWPAAAAPRTASRAPPEQKQPCRGAALWRGGACYDCSHGEGGAGLQSCDSNRGGIVPSVIVLIVSRLKCGKTIVWCRGR
jgi:hypothetical protein